MFRKKTGLKQQALNTVSALAIVASVGLIAPSAIAQVAFDNDNVNDLWSDDLNWDGDAEPLAGDDVEIDLGGVFAVILDVTRTINSLTIGSDDSLNFQNGFDLTVSNDVVNDGGINLQSTGSATDLVFAGGGMISGGGILSLEDNAQNRVIATGGGTLTNAAGHVIAGSGQILANLGNLVNDGVISSAHTIGLTIDPSTSVTNNGSMQANGPGGLIFNAGAYNNAGTIDVFIGSKLDLNNSVTINGGTINTTGTGVVNQNGFGAGATLNDVVINGDLLNENNEDATVTGTFEHNDGVWALQSTGSATDITFVGGVTIDGNGAIEMSDDPNNRIISNNTVTTVGPNYTIRGSGQLMANLGGMVNDGTIEADQTTAITLDPNALGFTNNGTMTASGAGGFIFNVGTFNNNSSIDIETGSKLDIGNSVVINGGTINTSGTGIINQNGFGAGAVLNNVTVNGNLLNVNNEDATVTGTFEHNNGTWSLNSTGSATDITFSGGVTISGNGEIAMSDNPNNRVISNNTVTTVGPNYTIRGSGQLMANLGGMVNNGTIEADQATAITLDPNALGFTNNATMTASGAGGFIFNGGTFNNNSSIDIETGSKLDIGNSVVINGGTINTSGTGIINQNGVGAGAILNNVTVNGNLLNGNNEDATVTGTFEHNNGIWSLNSTGSATDLTFSGGVTINGNGAIEMSDNANNRVITNNTVVTIGPNYTIRGSGQILANLGGAINQGTIEATGATALVVDPNALGFDNDGVMEALGTGGLQFNGGFYDNAGGVINVANGSELELNNSVTVTGGVINTTGSGAIMQRGSTVGATLDNLTVNGTIINENSFDATVTGTLVHHGEWQLNSTGAVTAITFSGGATIDGTGKIVMGDNAANRVTTNNTVMTIGSDYTIEGRGQLFANLGGGVNMGTVRGNVASGTLFVDANGQLFDNQGTVEARDGGTVEFNSHLEVVNSQAGGTELVGGIWKAFGLSTIDLTGAAITTNNADVTITGAGSVFAAMDTIETNGAAGALRLGEGRLLTTVGDFNNAGTVELSSGGTLRVTGTFTQTDGETALVAGVLENLSGPAQFTGGAVTGSGTILGGADFGAGVMVSVGASPGIINVVGDTLLNAIFDVELDGLLVEGALPNIGEINTGLDAALIDFDQLNVFGQATLGTDMIIDVVANFTPVLGDFFDIFTADSFIGDLSDITLNLPTDFEASIVTLLDPIRGGTVPAQAIRLTYIGEDDPPVETPEPGAMAMLLSALAAAGYVRRRQKGAGRA